MPRPSMPRRRSGCCPRRWAPTSSRRRARPRSCALTFPTSTILCGGWPTSAWKNRRGRAWSTHEPRANPRARHHPGRRPRHALLAAQPRAQAQAVAQHRRRPHYAPADGRSFAASNIWIVTSDHQAPAVRRQLPRVAEARVLVEPFGRNTAAAMGLAAIHLMRQARPGQDALMAVLPADHYIGKPARYLRIARAALTVAARGQNLIVLGVPPTRPETGYGYIERAGRVARARGFPVYAVRRFTEKPELARARKYVASGRYDWNAGMFFWRVSTFLEN